MLATMKEWGGGKPETPCGSGSTLKATEGIRGWLPVWFKTFNIHRLADVGCGDQNWIRTIKLPPVYQGFDLIPRNDNVQKLDLCSEPLPGNYDAILCRHCLNHLPVARVLQALWLFSRRATYLITTQHSGPWKQPDTEGHFAEYDLTLPPFELGQPIAMTVDTKKCLLAVWRF